MKKNYQKEAMKPLDNCGLVSWCTGDLWTWNYFVELP